MSDVHAAMIKAGWTFDKATRGFTKRGVGWVSRDQAADAMMKAQVGEPSFPVSASRVVASIVAKAVANE